MLLLGRWIKWSNDDLYPTTNITLSASDPKTYALGFWNTPFSVNFKYTDEFAAKDWIPELADAATFWNTHSNLAKVSFSALGYDLDEPEVNNSAARTNSIFLSTDVNLFGSTHNALANTWLYMIYKEKTYCSTGNWNYGPIILEADIGINANINWYPNSIRLHPTFEHYPINSILAHEIGHGLGLNHWPRNKKRLLMNASHSNKRKIDNAQSDDIIAINSLYGYDGLNGPTGTNPWYNSIPCDYFVPTITNQALIGTGPNGEPIGFGLGDPCNNCLKDPYEDGINCGEESGCGVSCEDLCSYDGLNLKFINYTPPFFDYTVAKHTVQIIAREADIGISSGDFKYIKAGKFIDIIPFHYFFDTGTLSDVEFTIGDCDCPEICDPVLPNIFTPGCDGFNDQLKFQTNGADYFEFYVLNRNEATVYSKSGPINAFNQHKVVDWSGVSTNGNSLPDGVYYYVLKLISSCNGTSKELSSYITIINGPENPCDETSEKTIENNELKATLMIYPNPSQSRVTLDANNFIISDIILMDSSGRTLKFWDKVLSKSFDFDLSEFRGEFFIIKTTSTQGEIFIESISKLND